MKKVQVLAALSASVLLVGTAQATVQTINYISGFHNEPWVTAGSNGASNNVVYGDGANAGISPQSKCVDGNPIGTQRFCNDYNIGGTLNQTVAAAATPGTGNGVNGNNGLYWSNGTTPATTPTATYAGSLQYDDSISINYTDMYTGLTESWFKVTGGSLAWTGTVGFEVTVNPSASSGGIGGSFFGYSWTNSSVNLVTGARGTGNRCDLGFAGSVIVGSLLCGVANPASSYAYSSSGAYVNPDWALIHDLGNGQYELMMYSTRRTVTNSGNNLQERLTLSAIPVPGAVWLLGSAIGALGVIRRKRVA